MYFSSVTALIVANCLDKIMEILSVWSFDLFNIAWCWFLPQAIFSNGITVYDVEEMWHDVEQEQIGFPCTF